MQVVIVPNPQLLQKATPVSSAEIARLRATARKMAKLMYNSQGCGIAGPQVGLVKRLIVVDPEWGLPLDDEGTMAPQRPRFLFNPVIRGLSGEKSTAEEGCLSVPGITVPVERYKYAEVEAVDLEGQPLFIQAEDFFARLLQHEIDHLEGVTVFEHLDPMQRLDYLEKYQAALAAGAKPGDTSIPEKAQTRAAGAGL